MIKYLLNLKLAVAFVLLMNSCGSNDVDEATDGKKDGNNGVKALTEKQKYHSDINSYFYENMGAYYLWNAYLPKKTTLDTTGLPKEFFDKLLYKEKDKWSWAVDDYEGLMNSFKGIEKSAGYSLVLGRFSGSNDVFGIVSFVYKDTPADKAGIKRGDVLLTVNGAKLNIDNYRTLLGKEDLSLGLGRVEGANGISGVKKTISVKAIQLKNNPIVLNKVVEVAGKKVGYLLYDSFIADYDDQLSTVMADFKSKGVKELVLDLRYNRGGRVSSAVRLASLIGPSSVGEKLFVKKVYNSTLGSYLESKYGATSSYFVTRFESLSQNLNLSRVYVLTTGSTASSSELVINGLRPYMNVVTIGKTTSGKYTGSITIRYFKDAQNEILPSKTLRDKYGDYAIQPIIMKSANADGVTDYADGFSPNYELSDDFTHELGDENEAYFAKALGLISGKASRMARVLDFESTPSFEYIPYYPEGKMWMRNGFVEDWPIGKSL